MRQRALGSTQISVTELTLGMWQLSGEGHPETSAQARAAVVERARTLGIEVFQCAESYGRGQILSDLGRIVGSDDAAKFVCLLGTDRDATPARKRFDREYLQRALDLCLMRLGRAQLDVLLLHNPSPKVFESDGVFEWLRGLVSSGAVRAWGVSAGSAEVARLAVKCGAQVVQVPHNVFHTDELDAITSNIVADGVGVLARTVLAHGLLCGLWPSDKEFPPEDHRAERWTADELRVRIRQLNALRPVVGGEIPTMRAAALRYVLRSTLVSSAVIGPRTPLQLDQLVREASVAQPYFSDDKLRTLEARLRSVGVRA